MVDQFELVLLQLLRRLIELLLIPRKLIIPLVADLAQSILSKLLLPFLHVLNLFVFHLLGVFEKFFPIYFGSLFLRLLTQWRRLRNRLCLILLRIFWLFGLLFLAK